MNKLTYLLVLFALISCNQSKREGNKRHATKKNIAIIADSVHPIQYTEQQLKSFLDSVGHLSTQSLSDKVAFGADSVFKNLIKLMNKQLSPADFGNLKTAIKLGMIQPYIAKKIFGELLVDSTCTAKGLLDSVKKGYVYLQYFPFDKGKKKFDEFAIRIGDQRHCKGNSEIYFFKGSRLIGKQYGYSRYDNGIEYYKANDGRTIIYEANEFTDGSGIWWNNYFFYKYDDKGLIPILNIPQNANMQAFWGVRILWFETKIKKTNPLTLEMVYNQQFYNRNDTGGFEYGPEFFNDSTNVIFKWDKKSSTLKGDYANFKINEQQILTYYVTDNELLFININYQLLKKKFNKKEGKALGIKLSQYC
ncbi:MAG: hypothetical protein H7289_15325 [Mucilaginibacter sp.]|nr:hypothetical protein [Mucilaginibacter sp.]